MPLIFKHRKKICLILWLICLAVSTSATHLPALIPYRDGDKWGYCDSNKVVKIAPQWDEADFFCGDKAVVALRDNKKNEMSYCLIDKSGHYIIPPERHWNRRWSGWKTTMLNARDDSGRYGLIDTNNLLLLPFRYDRPLYAAQLLTDRYRPESIRGKWGLVGNTGEVLIPFAYDKVEELHGHDSSMPAFSVLTGELWQLVDIHGQPIAPGTYSSIYGDLNWVYSNHVRKGYLLRRQSTASGDDQPFKLVSLFGWIDYPANNYIEPRYETFNFISDKFYVADDRLYNEEGKRVLSSKYHNFYRIGDTVRCLSRKRVSRDSVELTQYFLDVATLAPLRIETTRHRYQPPNWHEETPWTCGTGAMLAQRGRDREARRPYLSINRKPTKDFVRDSVHWYTNYHLGINRIAMYGHRLTRNMQYETVADSNGNFLFPPFQSSVSIGALNLRDGLVVLGSYHANSSSFYTVADLRGNELVATGDRIVSYAFRGPGGALVVVAASLAAQTLYSWRVFDDNYYEGPVITSPNAQLCDPSLKPLPQLKQYSFKNLVDSTLNISESYTGIIQVTDSLHKQGFVNLQGKVLLKDISFRYSYINRQSSNVLMVDNTQTNRGQQLIDLHNHNLMPGVSITSVRVLKDDLQQYTELFHSPSAKESSLMQVYYQKGDDHQTRFVYMDEDGRLFAGKL